jgi:hypothetical protein
MAGLVAIILVAGVGAVAAYDYTVGGVGLLPASWKAEAPQATPCCQQAAPCCTETASPTEEDNCGACPSCSACPSAAPAAAPTPAAGGCPFCQGDKTATPNAAESIPAPKLVSPAPND